MSTVPTTALVDTLAGVQRYKPYLVGDACLALASTGMVIFSQAIDFG